MSYFLPASEHPNFEGEARIPPGVNEQRSEVFTHARTGIQIRLLTGYRIEVDAEVSRVDVYYPPTMEPYPEAKR